MKTLVVAIDSKLTQFHEIEPVIEYPEDSLTVRIVKVTDSEIDINKKWWDLHIAHWMVGYEKPYDEDVCKSANIIYSKRYPKDLQHLVLEQRFGGTTGYQHLKTYGPLGSIKKGMVPEGNYIAKPCTGARSMGIFTVDTSKLPLGVLIRRLRDGERTGVELVKVLETIDITDFNKGQENRNGEASEYFWENYCLQETFPKPFKEYRFMSCGGHASLFERSDLDNDYNGYSSHVDVNVRIPYLEDIYNFLLGAFKYDICTSVDIAVDMNTGTWTIFEFQNQWGIENIRPELNHKLVTVGLRDTLINQGLIK